MKSLHLLFVLALGAAYSADLKSGIDLTAIDKNCKPCDDFWRYASGTWLDQNPIPATQSGWGTMSVISDQNRERLKVILDAEVGKSKIGNFYAACMDTERTNKLGWQPIAADLEKIAKIASVADLYAAWRDSQLDGRLAPVTLGARADLKNSEQTIVSVTGGGLSLPDRNYYLNDDARSKRIRSEFVAHVERMLKLAGREGDLAGAAQKILALETLLAKPMLTRVERRDPYATYHVIGIEGATKLLPGFDFKSALTKLGIDLKTPVGVSEPRFMEELAKLTTTVPLEDWKLWMSWSLISSASETLSDSFRAENFAFNGRVMSGRREQDARWKTCVEVVDRLMADALGQIYVAKHFPPQAKQRMDQLVENLRDTLRDELKNSSWMAPATKEAAVKKLEAFRPKIGYAAKWKTYDTVTVSKEDLYGSVRSAALAQRKYRLSRIGQPRERDDFGMSPPTVNAYYSPTMNEIAFPAGILQPPMFDMSADDAMNYGGIGAVIGHEMGHGFDDQGSKYDAEGNLKNWWTPEDRKKFEERAACIIEQYNTLDVGDGLRHNGNLVVGEAMGDLGGVTLAYKAYKKSLNGKPAPVIDGLTGDQRFFIAFARVWANQQRPEAVRMRLTTDPHPISKWRAIGTLQNFAPFHEAFGCKQGDFMVRPVEKQCKLY
ncbi:MAG: M13 family metallopeptidase [Acidobacteria bacterium]|nr:M13 family metallopeptidase [Acidobacteriota bacterium]